MVKEVKINGFIFAKGIGSLDFTLRLIWQACVTI